MSRFEQANQPDHHEQGLNSPLEHSQIASVEVHAAQTQALTNTAAHTHRLVTSGELPAVTLSTHNSAGLTTGETHPREIQPVTDTERQTAQSICAALKSSNLSDLQRLIKGEKPDELRQIADLVNTDMQLGTAFGCRAAGSGLIFSLDGPSASGENSICEVNMDVDHTLYVGEISKPDYLAPIPGVLTDTVINQSIEPAQPADFFNMLQGLVHPKNSNASAADSSSAPAGRGDTTPVAASAGPAVGRQIPLEISEQEDTTPVAASAGHAEPDRTVPSQPGFGQVVQTQHPDAGYNTVQFTDPANGHPVTLYEYTNRSDGAAVRDEDGQRRFGRVEELTNGSYQFVDDPSLWGGQTGTLTDAARSTDLPFGGRLPAVAASWQASWQASMGEKTTNLVDPNFGQVVMYRFHNGAGDQAEIRFNDGSAGPMSVLIRADGTAQFHEHATGNGVPGHIVMGGDGSPYFQLDAAELARQQASQQAEEAFDRQMASSATPYDETEDPNSAYSHMADDEAAGDSDDFEDDLLSWINGG